MKRKKFRYIISYWETMQGFTNDIILIKESPVFTFWTALKRVKYLRSTGRKNITVYEIEIK